MARNFAQQWKLCIRAQEATLKEIANSKLRRSLARNKSSSRADTTVGDSALFYKAQSRKGCPRWMGSAKILDLDDARVMVSCQSQTFKVDRYCVRKRLKETDATD